MTNRTPIVLQSEAAECGLACLAMIAGHYGLDVNLRGLRQQYPASMRGYTLRRLLGVAAELGMDARPMRAEVEALDDVRLPAILHWDMDHFVVLAARGSGRFTIHDPARGERLVTKDELASYFTGVVIDFDPPRVTSTVTKPSIKLSRLLPQLRNSGSLLWGILAITVVAQLLALATPLYVQTVIDHVLTRGNASLLLVISLAFAGIMVFGVLVDAIRRWTVIHLGNAVGFALSRHILSQLYRLPIAWFEKRHVGDVVSRISSVDAVREFLTTSTIAAIIDIAMVLIVSMILLAYSPVLTALIVASVVIYTIVSLTLYPTLRRKFADFIALSARQESFNVESIRAARVIRLNGFLHEREAQWSAIYSRVAAAGLQMGSVTIAQSAARTLIFTGQLILIVYVGAHQALSGDGLTVGMMFAVLSYRNILSDRATALVDRYFEYRVLDIHLDRISDIVLEVDEPYTGDAHAPKALEGSIHFRDVFFSYDADGFPILKNINLTVAPREFIAITGASGAGKSTLIKLLLGLVEPRLGSIHLDDTKVCVPAPNWLLSQISVVMQDDVLISGTIADNIAFFDPEMDMRQVEAAAKAAMIDSHIDSLPMRYMSIIGDMGAALSAGQRQRMLLARALYRNPQVLILDEGTANLDERTEVAIADIVSSLDVTRIVVAHRPELIARADRILNLEDGHLVEIGGRKVWPIPEVRSDVA
ncbi:peptidase domain-containing ABC transporter [Brevundimonas nasdae]|uniref:peptidase domain-containing ABC transporter n=1 Tax=Brevundimonas nasdae TaxID=172043 RepID=UPI003F68DC0F